MVGPVKRRGSKAAANEPAIDDEFQSRIPKLNKEEIKLIEESIVAEGCRDPLVVWQGWLVDGHHRLAICKALKVPYKTISLNRSDREQVLDWIDRNQLGRRNLHPDTAALLRGRVYNRRKQKWGGNRKGDDAKSRAHSEPLTEPSPTKTYNKLAEEFGVSRETVKRDGAYAAAVDALKPIDPELEAQVIRGEGPPRKRVIEAAQAAKESPEKAKKILKDTGKKKAHVSYASGEQEWYTPEKYIIAARNVMGGIDVDPASCAEANETVKATIYYSANDDGLTKEWNGKVWLQPPYAVDIVKKFCEKLIYEYLAGRTTEAIILTNNATETAWFHDMSGFISAVCSPRGRIEYVRPGGDARGSPLQGQIFMYLGPNVEKFAKYFSVFGFISYPAPPATTPPAPTPDPPPAPPTPIRKPDHARPTHSPYPEEYNKILGIDTRPLTEQLAEIAKTFLNDGSILVCPDPEADEETVSAICNDISNRVLNGEVTESIIITYANITSPRFITLSMQASAICFAKDGIVVFYIGQEPRHFASMFFERGLTVFSLKAYAKLERRLQDLDITARLALTRAGVEDKEKQDKLLSAEYQREKETAP